MESAYKTCMEQKKNAEKFENWERMVKRDSVSFLQVVVQKYLQDQIPFEKLTEVLETVGTDAGKRRTVHYRGSGY